MPRPVDMADKAISFSENWLISILELVFNREPVSLELDLFKDN